MKFKNIILITFVLTCVGNVYAQKPWHDKIEWEILKIGYANTADLVHENKSGFLGGSEFRYNWTSSFSTGIATDFSLFFSNTEEEMEDFDLDYLAKFSLTADYNTKLTNGKSAFFGLAIGNLSTNTIFIRDGDETGRLVERSGFVFGPRVGFEYNNFRVTLQKTISGQKNIPNNLTLGIGFILCNNNGAFREKPQPKKEFLPSS